MIPREIAPRLVSLFGQYPIVTVTGPRQAGKTTLCRSTFPELGYANLEDHDVREFAEMDPRRFLAQFPDGAVLDEIQHVPRLLSFLQALVDEDPRNGRFVLTGSEQFGLTNTISQSLAGRTALLRLLPFTLAERAQTAAPEGVDDILYSGCYPRIHDQGLDPKQALADYLVTYVERDAIRIGGIRAVAAFRRFIRLCAGRVGQLLNLERLGSDAGVSHSTARSWLEVLSVSDIVFRLEPHYTNLRKRIVKSPKLYFVDVGLAAHLIGIRSVGQLATHPLRGQLFENAVIVEALKHSLNHGLYADLSFFRTGDGLECDLLYPTSTGLAAIEIKLGATVAGAWFNRLNRIRRTLPEVSSTALVYGGSDRQHRAAGHVLPLTRFAEFLSTLDAQLPNLPPDSLDNIS
ncbi:MAG: ATP-binding protein [bacterium]|nr:ATP-binding protein [bacterium]